MSERRRMDEEKANTGERERIKDRQKEMQEERGVEDRNVRRGGKVQVGGEKTKRDVYKFKQ